MESGARREEKDTEPPGTHIDVDSVSGSAAEGWGRDTGDRTEQPGNEVWLRAHPGRKRTMQTGRQA